MQIRQALTVAVSAAQAVERLGMPEARIVLAQAVTYVASAPKSNAAYLAVDKALSVVMPAGEPHRFRRISAGCPLQRCWEAWTRHWI